MNKDVSRPRRIDNEHYTISNVFIGHYEGTFFEFHKKPSFPYIFLINTDIKLFSTGYFKFSAIFIISSLFKVDLS